MLKKDFKLVSEKKRGRSRRKEGEAVSEKKKRMMCLDGGQCGEAVYGWMGKDGVQERTAEDVYQWIGQKVIWGGMEATRFVRVFYYFRQFIISGDGCHR